MTNATRGSLGALSVACIAVVAMVSVPASTLPGASRSARTAAGPLYETSHVCTACHNGLSTSAGEDVSIASEWRATMMANSGRDPYWQASVRREVLDHPAAQGEIEDECTTCHMPMMRSEAHFSGGAGNVLARLPLGANARGGEPLRADRLAADGVSCTVCHQMTSEGFGKAESFNGGYRIDTTQRWRKRIVYGPYDVDSGRTTIMHSSSEFEPRKGTHIRESELCATCHTLFTSAIGPDGKPSGRLPEQVPYQEWQHSTFSTQKSCQNCHMPVVADSMAFSRVWGQKRAGLARHDFRGGNFFMLDMLNRYRDELAVEAPAAEMTRSVTRTIEHLQSATARVEVRDAVFENGRVVVNVAVTNLAGHKFPTAYPSRRAWLDVVVTDATGRKVFESGALRNDGAIDGNDNDANATAFEPHYREIRAASEVQIYESIMADAANRPTTGLLSAVRYAKDNRLLPNGFDKTRASADVAVHGAALEDPDFIGGSDVVRYSVDAGGAQAPFSVTATLRFQPIGHRWAVNLGAYNSAESSRFLRYYGAMSQNSAVSISTSTARTR